MHTFKQKAGNSRPMAFQAQTPGTTGDRAHAAGILQRAVGNQAVQRLLETQPSYFAASSRAGEPQRPRMVRLPPLLSIPLLRRCSRS